MQLLFFFLASQSFESFCRRLAAVFHFLRLITQFCHFAISNSFSSRFTLPNHHFIGYFAVGSLLLMFLCFPASSSYAQTIGFSVLLQYTLSSTFSPSPGYHFFFSFSILVNFNVITQIFISIYYF